MTMVRGIDVPGYFECWQGVGRESNQGAWEDSFLMTDDTRYYEFSSFMHRESESN